MEAPVRGTSVDLRFDHRYKNSFLDRAQILNYTALPSQRSTSKLRMNGVLGPVLLVDSQGRWRCVPRSQEDGSSSVFPLPAELGLPRHSHEPRSSACHTFPRGTQTIPCGIGLWVGWFPRSAGAACLARTNRLR